MPWYLSFFVLGACHPWLSAGSSGCELEACPSSADEMAMLSVHSSSSEMAKQLQAMKDANEELRAELSKERSLRRELSLQLFESLTGSELFVDITPLTQYQVPGNVEICEASDSPTPEAYTNPENLPLIVEQNYAYRQYSDDSGFGKALQLAVQQADDILTDLDAGLLAELNYPAMMFDIDNTLAYTTENDTDLVGGALPMTAVTEFARRWCKGLGGKRPKIDCYFFTARYCTTLKANAVKIWVERTFPKASKDWINSHISITGHIGGCQSDCSVAYKDVLRNWYQQKKGVNWVMSVGDQYTDFLGRSSGVKVKLPNAWFDSSKVPNSQSQGRSIPLVLDSEDLAQYCPKKCAEPPSEDCVAAGLEADQIYKKTTLEYCLQQTADKVPDQIYGCKYSLATQETTCST